METRNVPNFQIEGNKSDFDDDFLSQSTKIDDFCGQFHAFTCIHCYHDDHYGPGVDSEGENPLKT